MDDYAGHQGLLITAKQHNYNDWSYDNVKHVLHGTILEIGSGFGTYSKKIISDFPKSKIVLCDISTEYVDILKKQFTQKNITIHKSDLENKTDYEKIGHEKFDSILGINVLDNVENDVFALQQLYKLLKNDGELILLLPACKSIFNHIDISIGRLRRYNKRELESKIAKTNFKIIRIFHFNVLGIIGWYLSGKFGKKTEVNEDVFSFYNKIVPLLKFTDKLVGNKIGMSIVCHLKK